MACLAGGPAVGAYRERDEDDEDPDDPGERGEDFAGDRVPGGEGTFAKGEAAQRVADDGDGLAVGEGSEPSGHRAGRQEHRARQGEREDDHVNRGLDRKSVV